MPTRLLFLTKIPLPDEDPHKQKRAESLCSPPELALRTTGAFNFTASSLLFLLRSRLLLRRSRCFGRSAATDQGQGIGGIEWELPD